MGTSNLNSLWRAGVLVRLNILPGVLLLCGSFHKDLNSFSFTVTFWILALDHDLRLVREELAYVALSDPAGTKVAIWDQLSMDEGKHFITYVEIVHRSSN